jgi:hypothetical protein
MGSNGGSGRPMWFRCSKCRKRNRWDRDDRRGYRRDVVLTGRVRKIDDGRSGGRNSNRLREYKCTCCGHVGWSRHTDIGANE